MGYGDFGNISNKANRKLQKHISSNFKEAYNDLIYSNSDKKEVNQKPLNQEEKNAIQAIRINLIEKRKKEQRLAAIILAIILFSIILVGPYINI